jgi:hypothetical protein
MVNGLSFPIIHHKEIRKAALTKAAFFIKLFSSSFSLDE